MDYKKDKITRLKDGQKIAFIATIVTLVLAIMKITVGYFFNSKVLVADGFHSGADLLAIFASGFGLWLASKKKTAKFPYGLYKAETLFSFIIGCLIIWAGVEIFKQGWHKLFYFGFPLKFPFFPVCASIISIITAYILAKKEKVIGNSINSQSLIANANESFLDILASSVVLIGILLAYIRIPYAEGAIVIIISLLIFKLGMENAWTSLLVLLDANLDPNLQTKIENEINENYGVKGVSDVSIRQAGPFKMVECNIETSPLLPLYRAHELADKAEECILKNNEHIESVFIHIEPSKEKIVSAIIPVREINGLSSKVYGHFGRAPYFIIIKLNEGNAEIEDFYYNEFLKEKKYIGMKVIKTVVKYKLDLLFTSSIGEISFYMLKDNFIDIYKIKENLTVKEIIDKYHTGKLTPIMAPTHSIEDSQVE